MENITMGEGCCSHDGRFIFILGTSSIAKGSVKNCSIFLVINLHKFHCHTSNAGSKTGICAVNQLVMRTNTDSVFVYFRFSDIFTTKN